MKHTEPGGKYAGHCLFVPPDVCDPSPSSSVTQEAGLQGLHQGFLSSVFGWVQLKGVTTGEKGEEEREGQVSISLFPPCLAAGWQWLCPLSKIMAPD